MTGSRVARSVQTVKIGRQPVVLVPLKLWREIEECLENQEALASKRFLRRIERARRDVAVGKAIRPFDQQ